MRKAWTYLVNHREPIAAGAMAGFLLGLAVAYLSKPATYENCLLANVRAGGDMAARLVHAACEKKFGQGR